MSKFTSNWKYGVLGTMLLGAGLWYGLGSKDELRPVQESKSISRSENTITKTNYSTLTPTTSWLPQDKSSNTIVLLSTLPDNVNLREAVRLNDFINTIKADPLVKYEGTWVAKEDLNLEPFSTNCKDSCVYLEYEDGFIRYNLAGKETTFLHRDCWDKQQPPPSLECALEEYVLKNYYIIINEEGRIYQHGKTDKNENDQDTFVIEDNETPYYDGDNYIREEDDDVPLYPGQIK